MARGLLRVYLGAAPGVGKTVAMLDEGHRRAGRGTGTGGNAARGFRTGFVRSIGCAAASFNTLGGRSVCAARTRPLVFR